MSFRSVLVTRSYEQVVDQLLERIHSGEFAPNQRLPTERELGELFGVSRGVIREAIKVLGTLGVVESRQGSGTFVSANLVPSVSRALVLSAKPEESSLLSLMEFRAPLEVLAAKLAAERRIDTEGTEIRESAERTASMAGSTDFVKFGAEDDRFHGLIYAAARNPFLLTVLGAIRQIQHTAVSLVVSASGSIDIAGAQHRTIAAAIADGDADGAAAAMSAHIAYSADALQYALSIPIEDRDRHNAEMSAAGKEPNPAR
jgi:GntR family transcriptional regulator, transcriptional repressor for pyruvate dehydrogenase complex